MRTKKDIVKDISEEFRLTQVDTKRVVQRTFDMIIDILAEEGRIELRNFGVFEVKRRKPRKARNPLTGESVQVDARNVVTFKPGKIMKEKVRKSTFSEDGGSGDGEESQPHEEPPEEPNTGF